MAVSYRHTGLRIPSETRQAPPGAVGPLRDNSFIEDTTEDGMEEIFLLIQKTYGIAGLVLLSPFVGMVVFFKQNTQLQSAVVAATKGEVEAQKQRVKDAQDVNVKLIEVIKEQSALNTETNLALERIGDALNEIQSKVVTQGR
jgi:hypothetical protein